MQGQNKVIAAYVRVSTDRQAKEGISLDAQKSAANRYAEYTGGTIFDTYADEGKSGKNTKRPAFQRMLKDARAGKFNTIFCVALDRFTRSFRDMVYIYEECINLGISLVFQNDNIDTSTVSGELMLHILSAFAQNERRITSRRVKEANDERVRQGKHTARDVLGYRSTKDGLVIVPDEAETVRDIYSLYTKWESLSFVAKILNTDGVRGKRGGLLTAESIKKILTNAIYVGLNNHHGNTHNGLHDEIIDMDTFNAVQALLDKNKRCL